MAILFANDASSTLQSSITTSATQLTVSSADAGLFPSPTSPDYFMATIADAAGNMEIMKCTSRAGAILTVVRAQEGTSAIAFAAGAVVDLRLTKGTMESFTQQSGERLPQHRHDISQIDNVEAENIPFSPAGSVSSTNVQAAIVEVDAEKAGLSTTNTFSGENTFSALAQFSAGAYIKARRQDNVDLNTVTDDGVHVVFNPSNAPGSKFASNNYAFLTVRRFPWDTVWVQQELEWAGLSGSRRPARWARRSNWLGWGPWFPLGGVATPEHFDAFGDGQGDDSDALEKAIRSGFPIELYGKYRITRKITASRNDHGLTRIQITGVDRGSEIVLGSSTAQIEIDAGDVIDGNTCQVVLRDFSIVPAFDAPTIAALRIQASETVGFGVLETTLSMENVHVRPASHSVGTLIGFHLRNMRLSEIVNCSAVGKRSALTVGGKGFDFSGSNIVIPVETVFQSCRSTFFERGFELSGAWEGVKLLSCDAIACSIGVKATSTNANIGDSLIIENCQTNTNYVGLWLEDIKNSRIVKNQLTGNAAWGAPALPAAFYGIYSRANQAAGAFVICRDNIVNGEQIKTEVGSGACIGMSIDGYASGSLGSDIGPNIYVGLKFGVQIGANVRNTVFDNSDQFFLCDSNVVKYTTGTPNRLRASTIAF